MFRKCPFPLKKIFLWLTVILLGLLVSYIILVSMVSIEFGISHRGQDGFIIPILTGIMALILCIFLFICYLRIIINLIREKDIIRSSK